MTTVDPHYIRSENARTNTFTHFPHSLTMSNAPTPRDSSDAQKEFDQRYITSTEITRRLRISRSALLEARRTGKLPNAIVVKPGMMFIWERDQVTPYLNMWEKALNFRRTGVFA